MKVAIWGVFVLSIGGLLVLLFKHKRIGRGLALLGAKAVIASFLLYGVNLLSAYTLFTLPINAATVGVVALLGLPGMAMLAALKITLF